MDTIHKIECECWYEWDSVIDRTWLEVCPTCWDFDCFEYLFTNS